MTAPDLLNIDLNLLVPLHALLTERSVTKAAERVSISQSAMSISLAKLRRLLDDPLLVKDGDRMALTPLAQSLVDPLLEALSLIRSTLGRAGSFDPATDSRTFTVMASDYTLLVVVSKLLTDLRTIAPQVSVNVRPLQVERVDLVRRGQCDLMVCAPNMAGEDAANFPNATLITDSFVVVVAEDHPDVTGQCLGAEQVSTLPYVHVTGLPQFVPMQYGGAATPQNTVAIVDTFTSAAHLLPGTRMFTIVQQRLFARLGPLIGLRSMELSAPVPPATESMYWHPRLSGDPGHKWLRSTLHQLATQGD